VLTTIPSDAPSTVSRGLKLIYAGRVVSGFGIGAISAVAPAYVSECCPKEVRGRITGCFQIMVAIGVMLSYFINCAFLFSGLLLCFFLRLSESPALFCANMNM
jgi:MFS family permease